MNATMTTQEEEAKPCVIHLDEIMANVCESHDRPFEKCLINRVTELEAEIERLKARSIEAQEDVIRFGRKMETALVEFEQLRKAFIDITTYYSGLPVKYQSVEHKEAMKLRGELLEKRESEDGP